MFGEGHHDSIIQRRIDEALACQDMLERALFRLSNQLAVAWNIA